MMKPFVLSILLFSLLLACQGSAGTASEMNNSSKGSLQEVTPTPGGTEENDVWSPTAIDECMAKVDVGEPYKFETSFNPFYLRADLDGNEVADYAVLIKGQNTKKRGVVICKDSKQPFVFGELSKPKSSLSSFENDNFVTNQWEISTKEYTRIHADPQGRKISPNAKGESILFVFEGGEGVSIYWDGKSFRIGE